MSTATQEEHVATPEELAEQVRKKIHEERRLAKQAEPSNPVSGAVYGTGTFLGATALGVGALIAAPLAGTAVGGKAGADKLGEKAGPVGGLVGGVGGAVGGLVLGAIGGVTVAAGSIVGGAGAGVYKFGQGTVNTFSSEEAEPTTPDLINKYRMVDMESYVKERDALYEGLLSSDGVSKVSATTVDTYYYDLLKIKPDATDGEIRKAYYKRAQETHPDKFPGDEQKHKEFQGIAEAYQVLSDPDKRKLYDSNGRDGVDQDSLMDSQRLYAAMFGSDKFQHMIGDMVGMMTAQQMLAGSVHDSQKLQAAKAELQKKQEERECTLSEALIRRCKTWESGDKETFIKHATEEKAVLIQETFGPDLLRTIGYVYHQKAKQLLGQYASPLGIRGFFSSIHESGHMFSKQSEALQEGLKAQMINQMSMNAEMQYNQSEGKGGDTEILKKLDELKQNAQLSTIGAMWFACMIDVETTLRKVVEMACIQNKKIVKERAGAIKKLGEIFEDI